LRWGLATHLARNLVDIEPTAAVVGEARQPGIREACLARSGDTKVVCPSTRRAVVGREVAKVSGIVVERVNTTLSWIVSGLAAGLAGRP
jgi:hypothetical protein